MRILLVNKYWYPRGGAEVVAMMTKTLLEEAGHEVAVFAMEHEKNEIHHDLFPSEIDYKKDSFLKKIKNVLKTLHNTEAKNRFEKMVKEFQPDVVHFHNIYHQLSFSLLEITKKYHIRSVMTLHDYKLLSPNYSLYHHGQIDMSILGKKYYRCILNNCMESFPESIVGTLEAYYRDFKKYHEMIDIYISPSKFLKNLFVQAGFEKRKIEVVRNPSPLREVVSSKNQKYVSYIGRLSAEKGVDILLHVASLSPEIPYAIVGTGPEEDSLRRWVQQKNLKNVTFFGFKTGKELESLYKNTRLLVVPSVWYENYPLTVLEAKAQGTVVLGSDIGGISEMLPKKFLFSPGDTQSLRSLIEKWYTVSFEERKEVGQKFRLEIKKENDPKEYVERLLELYQS